MALQPDARKKKLLGCKNVRECEKQILMRGQ